MWTPISSVALHGTELRDVQARERTFLSFLRTAMYCFGAGIFLSGLGESQFTRGVSLTFVIAGLTLVVFASADFFPFVHAVRKGRNPPMSEANIWAICAVALVVIGITGASLFCHNLAVQLVPL